MRPMCMIPIVFMSIFPTLPHTPKIFKKSQSLTFFVEDESKTEKIFLREKRILLQCDSLKIAGETERFEAVLDLFAQKFDVKMVATLKKMTDFNLYEWKVNYGEATFGFGKAYFIGVENMDELVARGESNPHHGVK